MEPNDLENIKKILSKQATQIKSISKRLDVLEKKDCDDEEFIEDSLAAADVKDEKKAKEENVVTKTENPTNFFKIFGIIGVILIILGVIYFYKYAVDMEWIGILGRIAIGVMFSLAFLVAGMVLYKKEYVNFSQLIIAGGLGLLYFTIFATYHFRNYREELGMNLIFNTILLLLVMLGGTMIGMKLNSRWIVYGALLAGFIAAFLSGISGDSMHILIFIFLIDIFVFFIAKQKGWYIGIPAQVLTYIAYSIWYVQGVFDPRSIINQTSHPVFITFIFLALYYVIFTGLSFLQASNKKEAECMAISIINTVAVAGFGLGIINKYYPELNGLYLMFIAAITISVGALSKRMNFTNIFDIHFLMTFIVVAIAVPVQFDNTIVTVLWVLMALGLAYSGIKISNKKLFYAGYFGFIIPMLRCIYDFTIDNFAERNLAVASVIAGFIVLRWMMKEATIIDNKNPAFNIYTIIGIIWTAIWVAVEIYYVESISRQVQSLSLSLGWALLAILVIAYGVVNKNKIINWCGVIIFGIVILKLLIFDLSFLENIYRVLALVVVGVLALIGSFTFVKNREKLKGII